ncbi:2-phytyl-1,4-beta-naphthoquinone methyltransferase, chloroplastic [Apostasia shenzhenica]|uniref:2-phytyl-1,4-beta-naphthoquinone methyltransferase, chloroplastic n=1 Tax=Apostasia shenzhenica TaxID=1088818 RepID=A0A2I0B4T2_9ASPA|nr:2-phytyl-1,4-beta-naphthoquinone methyltransferase, chloroplastic [Apostasia shenzhenica]
MGKTTGRDWMQIYSIYGTDEWQTVAFLVCNALSFAVISLLLLLYFSPFLSFVHSVLPGLPLHFIRFAAGFSGSVLALSALCLLFAAANVFYSSLPLRWDMAQRIVAAVPDWSAVRTALDVGCGRGILLNAVALQLKKEGSSGRVVGLDGRRETAVAALRRASAEGVQEYVTCREGDARRLPFPDGYFDVVVSAVHLSSLGRNPGDSPAAAAAERVRGLGELVRVLKPGGVGVVWDLVCGPDFAHKLKDMRMEEVRVSERVTAYMVGSHIVSFRKPITALMDPSPPPDWRANIC